MKIENKGRLIPFADVEYGGIFLTDFGERRIVRAIKAYVPLEDDGRLDRIVTIGPFTKSEGFPGIYDPEIQRGQRVLDISDSCQFSPSVDPQDILESLPSTKDSLGLAFILEDSVLLGVANFERGSKVTVGFLNIESGKLQYVLDHIRLIATSRWKLISAQERHEVLSEFHPATRTA